MQSGLLLLNNQCVFSCSYIFRFKKKQTNYSNKGKINLLIWHVSHSMVYCQGVYVTIGNPAFCLFLCLTGVQFLAELQHGGDVSQQKIKCRPIRPREIGGVTLSDVLYVVYGLGCGYIGIFQYFDIMFLIWFLLWTLSSILLCKKLAGKLFELISCKNA